MSDTYNDEMFNFLTQQENFAPMLRLVQQFESVKRRLVEEFWQEVQSKLEELANGTAWQVIEHEGPWQSWWGLQLVKKSWNTNEHFSPDHNPFAIRIEPLHKKPRYGVWINHADKNLNTPDLRQALQKLEVADTFSKKDSNYWPFYDEFVIDFSNNEDLSLILPQTREALSEDTAQSLFNLTQPVGDVLDKFLPKKN